MHSAWRARGTSELALCWALLPWRMGGMAPGLRGHGAAAATEEDLATLCGSPLRAVHGGLCLTWASWPGGHLMNMAKDNACACHGIFFAHNEHAAIT